MCLQARKEVLVCGTMLGVRRVSACRSSSSVTGMSTAVMAVMKAHIVVSINFVACVSIGDKFVNFILDIYIH